MRISITHLFWWIYYLPEPIQKLFETFWKRIFCSRGIHLLDYCYNGYHSLSCDVCNLNVDIIDTEDTYQRLRAEEAGLISSPLDSISDIQKVDPEALVITSFDGDNDYAYMIKNICIKYLLNLDEGLTVNEVDLLKYVRLLMSGSMIESSANMMLRINAGSELKKLDDDGGRFSFKVHASKISNIEDTWYNGEIVVISSRLRKVWQF